jgi:hypothetical protein
MAGEWKVQDGALQGMGTILSARGFPGDDAVGFQRMEFRASAMADAPRVSDMSSLLHARPVVDAKVPWTAGYFFQFAGRWNTMHRIARRGEMLVADQTPETVIVPGKTHDIVVENDKGRLSLFVDGVSVLTVKDDTPILGEGADRVGFYFYTPFKVHDVKVYIKRLASGLDEDAAEVQ